MHHHHRVLVRKLALAVVVKLCVITALWWAFFSPHRVEVDSERAAAHLVSGQAASGTTPASTPSKEATP
ncbi:MAG: cytochrome oxidase putative small subunit CydP [Macromonas sp.]